MNRLHLILAILCCMLLCTCGHRYDARLTAIDSIIEDHADSAQMLLEAFDTSDASTANRMYHRLLLVKISDHLDQLEATTEEAEQLVTYFEDDGDERLMPIAYYYGGRICAENSNVPQALDYFHKAEILLTDDHSLPMPKGDKDKSLLSKVYSQMGYLFVYRNMYEEARRCSQKSYELDKAIQDTVGMIFNLRDIGISYKWADKEKEALPYLYMAHNLADESKNVYMNCFVMIQIASTFLDINELDSAKKYGLPLLKTISYTDSTAVLSIITDIYRQESAIDSCEYYSKLLLNSHKTDAQCHAHHILTDVYLRRNQSQEALLHFHKYQELKYQIDKVNSTEEIAQANSAYNYQKKEAENYELKIENDRKEKILLMIVAAIIVLVLVFFLFFNRYRHRQAAKLKELERIKEEQHLQSEKYIAENQQRIAELEEQLQHVSALNADQRREMESEKAKLTSSNEIASLRNVESKRALDNIRSSSVFIRMMDLAEHNMPQKISDDDWQELEAVITQECDKFKQEINRLCHPNPIEYRVCLLLKARVEPVKIAVMIMRAKNSVSSIRSRLYQKAFGSKGSAKDWDEVIYSL